MQESGLLYKISLENQEHYLYILPSSEKRALLDISFQRAVRDVDQVVFESKPSTLAEERRLTALFPKGIPLNVNEGELRVHEDLVEFAKGKGKAVDFLFEGNKEIEEITKLLEMPQTNGIISRLVGEALGVEVPAFRPDLAAFRAEAKVFTDRTMDRGVELIDKIKAMFKSTKNLLFVVDSHNESRSIKLGALIHDLEISPFKFEEPKGLFWTVKSSTGQKAYLLGSIHMTPEHLLDFNGKIRKRFAKANALALEVDMTQVDELLQQRSQEQLALNRKAIAAWPPEDQKKVRAVLESFFLKQENLFLAGETDTDVILVGAMKLHALTEGYKSGIDFELLKQATERKMPLLGLEKRQAVPVLQGEQPIIKALYAFKDFEHNHLEFVNLLIGSTQGATQDKIDGFVKEWEAGNLQAFDIQPIEPEAKREMMRRNMEMALKIDELIRSGQKVFCVAGCAHMPGDFGIVKMLENMGYAVNRK